MNKQEFEVMKKILSTGSFDDLEIKLVTAPRIHVKQGDMVLFLDANTGLALNRHDYNPDFILRRLRDGFTQSNIGEAFAYACADTVTNQSERKTLCLALQEYEINSYSGILAAPDLMNHILKDESGNESPESIVGINTQKSNRLLFNFIGSEASNDRPGYDRLVKGKYATVYLNSKTGEWLAEKTPACKAAYSPLAHLSPNEVSDAELVKALGFAPPIDSIKQ